jgi:hypothetical protein
MCRDGVVTGSRSCDYGGTLGTITGPLAGVATPARPGRWAVMDESEQLGAVASCRALRAPPALAAPTCESMRVMHADPGGSEGAERGRRATDAAAWTTHGGVGAEIVRLENCVRWSSVPRTAAGGRARGTSSATGRQARPVGRKAASAGSNVGSPAVSVKGPGGRATARPYGWWEGAPEDGHDLGRLASGRAAANRPARSRPSWPTVSYPRGETAPVYYNTVVQSTS